MQQKFNKDFKKERKILSARGGWKGEADFMWQGLPWVE